ncbi:MAG TPA: HAMP domain-containing protein [Leucothrix mucor]|uniref:histidine kinase n=1 Tax=Leucothrix mucor TaxID=45248 RepID=A0A7V2SZ94_LEUMU|nr:HAMP domain-containing protein [Leucothrix mucor]
MRPHLKPLLIQAIPITLVVVLLAISLTLLRQAMNNPYDTEDLNEWLLLLNGLIIVILSGLIIYNSVQLVIRLKSKQAGSRYTARLMVAFAVLTIIPVLVVSFFSVNFLGDRIDAWFNVKIANALDDSLELSQHAFDVRMRQHLFNLEQVAKEMVTLNPNETTDFSTFLNRKREQLGAYEMVLLDANKKIIVYSGNDTDTILPSFPEDTIFRSLSLHGYMFQLEPTSDSKDTYSRVALTVQPGVETLVLTALFSLSKNNLSLAESVIKARSEYKQTEQNREQIKQYFRITLLLIMVLSILFSILAAFLYSQKLTEPIRSLLAGTVAVAEGNLSKKLPISDKDDFHLLARSFNIMTAHLTQARSESEFSQKLMEQQRDYLNIVLDHISSGVITIDENGIIRRINAAAEQVLQTPLKQYHGKSCEQLCTDSQSLSPLFAAIQPYFQNNAKEWQLEVNLPLPSGHQALVCKGTKLPSLEGYVLVIDDITEVIQAEHEAAWSEVARRLAHEIKNPLTPIQLSTERLQFKLLPELSDQSAKLLKRMSKTIIHQVDNMKIMVDAFSQYARAPALEFQHLNINMVVKDVAELYTRNSQQAEIVLNLEDVPNLQLDLNRIRQMLVNLVKNALEAMPEKQTFKQVILSTSQNHDKESLCYQHIVIEVSDNGEGISKDVIANLFTPYVSTKSSGTGLGLSIVKKIVEEHSGKIFANNRTDEINDNKGAKISVCLPLIN